MTRQYILQYPDFEITPGSVEIRFTGKSELALWRPTVEELHRIDEARFHNRDATIAVNIGKTVILSYEALSVILDHVLGAPPRDLARKPL